MATTTYFANAYAPVGVVTVLFAGVVAHCSGPNIVNASGVR